MLYNLYIKRTNDDIQIKHVLTLNDINFVLDSIKNKVESVQVVGRTLHLSNHTTIAIFDVSKALNPENIKDVKNEMDNFTFGLSGVNLLKRYGINVTHEFKIPPPFYTSENQSAINPHDYILNYTKTKTFISFSRETSTDILKAKEELLIYGLIEPNKNSFRLTKEGYNAITLGGFENWKEHTQNKESNTTTVHLTNHGIINQGSTYNNSDQMVRVTKNKSESIYKSIGIGVLVTVVGGIILWLIIKYLPQ